MRKLLRLAFLAVGLTAGIGLCVGMAEIQAGDDVGDTLKGEARAVIQGEKAEKGDTFDPPSPSGEKRDIAAIKRVFNNPVEIRATEDPSMSVSFLHTNHKGLNCAVCHHRLTATGDRYVSCGTAPDCHVGKGVSPRGRSLFQAMHRPTSEHSCYACHVQERARFDDVKGCTTCHAQLVATP